MSRRHWYRLARYIFMVEDRMTRDQATEHMADMLKGAWEAGYYAALGDKRPIGIRR